MMYNRYIPQPDGSYRRSRAGEPDPPPRPRPPRNEPPKQEPAEPAKPPSCPPPQKKQRQECPPQRQKQKNNDFHTDSFLRQLLPKDFDTGDILVILLLLLMAGDCPEDRNNALLTIALYFMM